MNGSHLVEIVAIAFLSDAVWPFSGMRLRADVVARAVRGAVTIITPLIGEQSPQGQENTPP